MLKYRTAGLKLSFLKGNYRTQPKAVVRARRSPRRLKKRGGWGLRADPVLVTYFIQRERWCLLPIVFLLVVSQSVYPSPLPVPALLSTADWPVISARHAFLTNFEKSKRIPDQQPGNSVQFMLRFAMCRNYRTFGHFWNYWSYIVQRVKLSYKYDNYRTAGNAVKQAPNCKE